MEMQDSSGGPNIQSLEAGVVRSSPSLIFFFLFLIKESYLLWSKNIRHSTYALGNLSLGASLEGCTLCFRGWRGPGCCCMGGKWHCWDVGPCAGGRVVFPPCWLLSPLVFRKEDQALRWHRLVPLADPNAMPQPPAQGTPQPPIVHRAVRSSAPSSPPGTSGRGGEEEEVCSHPQLSQH